MPRSPRQDLGDEPHLHRLVRLARAFAARLEGFDISPVAVAQAAQRRAAFAMTADRAAFRVAALESTGLPDGCAHGAVCVDALGRATDRGLVLGELGRVLAPGARLVLTRSLRIGAQSAWHSQARDAGLSVEHVDERLGEPAMWERLYCLWIDRADELRSELGEVQAEHMLGEAHRMLPTLPGRRAVLLTLRRPASTPADPRSADTMTDPGPPPRRRPRVPREDPAVSQHRPARAAVFSAGSWGTAVAKVLADAGTEAVVHARRTEIADAVNTVHRNPAYWPDVELPASLTATTDPAAALAGAQYLVLSIPAQSLRDSLAVWAEHIEDATVIVSLMKGIEQGSHLRASQIITQVTGIPPQRIAVLSGPNLAREIMAGQPAAATVACPDEDVARRFQTACRTAYFRPYTSTDVIGCEVGGAVKNVIALAVGIATGMGLGHNAAALLVTRGLAEATRLATALGADPATLAGLAGLGDMVATCTSPLSRNRTFGANLGRGLSVDQAAAATRQTTEGVRSAEAILELARLHDVEMPITDVVSALLHGKATLHEAAAALMQRPPKPER